MSNISIHISNRKSNISSLQDLGRVYKHNLRKYKNETVKGYDETKIRELFMNENETLETAYKRNLKEIITDEVLEKYNKNKIESRKIKSVDDYIARLEKNKNTKNIAVEMIVQVGDKEYWDKQVGKKDKNLMVQIYKNYCEEVLQKEFPDFKIVSATVHLDETSPHMHVVGIPYARKKSGENGLEMKVSKSSVFTRESLSELQDISRKFFRREMEFEFDENFNLEEKEQGRNYDFFKKDLIIEKEKIEKFYNVFKEQKNVEDFKKLHDKIIENLENYEKELERENEISEKIKNIVKGKSFRENKNKEQKEILKNLEKRQEEVVKYSQDTVREIKWTMLDVKQLFDYKLSENNLKYEFKNLSKKRKKELADLTRDEFKGTKEYEDFCNSVIKEFKEKQLEKEKRLLEQTKLEREKLEKENKKYSLTTKNAMKKEIEELEEQISKMKEILKDIEKIKEEKKEEIKEEVKEEVKKEVKEEVKKEIKDAKFDDIKQEVKEEIKKEKYFAIANEVKKEIKEEKYFAIANEVKKEIKEELNTKEKVREFIETEYKQEFEDIKQEIEEETKSTILDKINNIISDKFEIVMLFARKFKDFINSIRYDLTKDTNEKLEDVEIFSKGNDYLESNNLYKEINKLYSYNENENVSIECTEKIAEDIEKTINKQKLKIEVYTVK